MANKPLKSIKFPGLSDTYTVPEVDDTLAVTGAAADAKKVGDEISDLKADLIAISQVIKVANNQFNASLSQVGKELGNYATLSDNLSYSVSQAFPVEEGIEYHFGLAANIARMAFYETDAFDRPLAPSNDNWYSGLTPSDYGNVVNWISYTIDTEHPACCHVVFTIPSGWTDRQGRSAKFIRFTYWSTTTDLCYFSKGNLVTETTAVDNVARERIETIDNIITAQDFTEQLKVADCLGDSHTAGVGSFPNYPSVLRTLLQDGTTINNFGAGGDSASDITARQGALYAICKPCTINDINSYTNNIPLELYSGNALRQFGSKWVGINKDALTGDLNCKLGNRAVYISYSSTNGFLIRPVSVGGGNINITQPTKITTTYMQTPYKSHILILCMGSNGVNNQTVETLANWNNLIAKEYMRYIIIGEPTQMPNANRPEYNNLMYGYFGTHYIDIHDYMIKYGLSDAGITPTTADEEAIANNNTPPSLMYDAIHYNQIGTEILAQQVYKKGVELGYWN